MDSDANRVTALRVLALGGYNRQAHLFAERSADEAADAMGLPVCRLHDRRQRCAPGQLLVGNSAGHTVKASAITVRWAMNSEEFGKRATG